jgi:ubiquinone/menaquinone biosynthesis C-methylase UbiE
MNMRPVPILGAWHRVRYSLYAPFYDLFAANPVYRRGRARSIAMAQLAPGERVLLAAAGTGLDLELLPRGIEIAAIDWSPAMLERLRTRAARLGLQVDARLMDAARLEFPDASFDCVLLHLALAVVPDPAAAIREAARVLRPGGRVAIFDKFLGDGARPSPLRRAANAVTGLIATEINLQLGPLLATAGLELRGREPAGFGGLFVAARAERPG